MHIELSAIIVLTKGFDTATLLSVLINEWTITKAGSFLTLFVVGSIAYQLIIYRFQALRSFVSSLLKKKKKFVGRLVNARTDIINFEQTKDEFISMASHQLRTPLTTIRGYISIMLEDETLSDEQKNMLNRMFISSNRMLYVISELLTVSRFAAGKFIIEKQPVDIEQLTQSVVDQLKSHSEAKDTSVDIIALNKISLIRLDETKIRQVLMNFIDNAIFYTPEKGKIEVIIEEDERSIELRVKDNGIGVPKEEQHQLFTKFFRATNAKKARPDGTGLGLFIAKKVITSQGGTIIFESKEGEGSTFGFSFPKDSILVTPSKKEEPSETENANAVA